MATPADQPSLIVLTGSLAGKVFVVDDSLDTVLIGSDASCRFALPGTGVAPIHARLWIDLEGITVYDTDSPLGVYINDDRVEGQARLRNGDILWLGQPGDDESVMLQCRMPGAGPAAAPPAAEPARAEKLLEGDEPAVEPEISATAAMNAIDLDPTVSLMPEPPVAPEPTVSIEPATVVAAEPEVPTEPEPEPEPPPEP